MNGLVIVEPPDELGLRRVEWLQILRGGPCAYCGSIEAETNALANLCGSCRRCNAAKDSMSLLEWLLARRIEA